MALKAVLLSCLASVAFAQTSTISTTYAPSSTGRPLNCSVNGVDALSIPKGEFLIVNETTYDYTRSSVNIKLTLGYDVDLVTVNEYYYDSYVYTSTYTTNPYGVNLVVRPIIESNEISHPADNYYYNFTLRLTCLGKYYYVYTKLPLVETNTYTPKFTKSVYTYTLFSSWPADLERLIELDPIIANDDDISNTEVIFSIQQNSYFDLQYNGVVPSTLNKNHSASLVIKTPNIDLTATRELTIFVTDLGFPRKSSNATLRIIPAQKNIPTFKRSFYIGDYYLNNTLSMRSQPELEAVSEQYDVSSSLISDNIDGYYYQNYFDVGIIGNGTIEIRGYRPLPELTIYKYGYLAFTLTTTYRSSNYVQTKGNTTIIIELHHES